MADTELLEKVKLLIGQTGDSADAVIVGYIDEVTDFMLDAGISAEKISASAGVVARGVSDLWDNDAGEVKFSPYFFHRVTQLAMKSNAEANSS